MKKKKQVRNMILAAVVLLAVVVIFALSVSKKQFGPDETYLVIDDREYTKQEFDYYFYSNANDFYNTFGQFAEVAGLDLEGDMSQQKFSEDKTWEDFFYDMSVEMISEYHALYEEAKANGFECDTDKGYENFKNASESYAASTDMEIADYYKKYYGPNATEANIEPIVRENYYCNEYRAKLAKELMFDENAVNDAYEADKSAYDSVDYRTFLLQAEQKENMTTEEKEQELANTKAKVEELVTRWKSGEDFNELALEYAPESQKVYYEEDASLAKGARKSQVSGMFQEWIFDEDRKQGDIEIFFDEGYGFYAVALFENRYLKEETKNEIAADLQTSGVDKMLENWTDELEIKHKR